MTHLATSAAFLAALAAPALAQSAYPQAIALVEGQLYYGDDRAGFDTPAGENPARYSFNVNGTPIYCEEITVCESSITAALNAPPEETTTDAMSGNAAKDSAGQKKTKTGQ